MLTNPFHFLSLFGHCSATRKWRVRWMSLLVWGPVNLIHFGVLLVVGSETDSARTRSLSLSLSLSLSIYIYIFGVVADRLSGHICVLVWFCLGILVFISITVLCGILDHLSSDCFWAHPWWGDVELGDGEVVCFQLFSLFLWLEKLMLSHGAFVVVIDLVMYLTDDHNKYCDCCYRTTCCACVCLFLFSFFCNCIYIVSY